MSLPSTQSKVQYILTSEDQALVVPFYFIENSHVRVVRTRNHVETVLTSGFDLSGAGDSDGGTLVLDGSQTVVGDRITIRRVVPLTQLVSYAPNDRFPASTHERALDRLTMIAQTIEEIAGRALIYGEGELVGVGNVLPGVSTRGGKVLGFTQAGALDLNTTLDEIRTLIIANPVDELTDVTDYGSVSDVVTSVADYGSIV